ncbi:SpoIID/LytB domain-containing protein [Isoptericola sp. b408]|uniref:SpoIID/LytB domain-containing protein n=1 Tax=Isoptericola sp. b408 TaxID=3064653 RepID=UPI0027123951|nr:SpoIID/LytB domain-containing protein [Isoptericola sp. b408]MDO8152696.1 SpoIID/LytB domain-containing protein [Isoptericola sp. b408]
MTAALIASSVAGPTVAAEPVTEQSEAVSAAPDAFRLEGSGYGHGVGMPQFGAYQMAREGRTATGILKHYYTGVGTPYRDVPGAIRVQVYGPDPYGYEGYGDTGVKTWVSIDSGSWRVRDGRGDTLVAGSGATTLAIKATSTGKVKVWTRGAAYWAKVVRIYWSGTRYYRPAGTPAVATVVGAHGAYRHGRLTTTVREGIPNLTNDVRLNTEYLYGIAEMPSSWGASGGERALRAQAITARSYALSQRTNKNLCRCHVVDDVRDQNFTGWKKENEGTNGYYGTIWKTAVDRTSSSTMEGRVLEHDGKPVAAHYFSSSGGRTANSEDVWSSVVPYERSVSDPYSLRAPGNSYSSWTRTLTQASASKLFGLPTVVSVEVTARWSSGQMRSITATNLHGTTSTISGKADQMRRWIGRATTAGNLPAAWITGIRGY